MKYSRQEVLKHIGKDGQAKLSKSSAVIVGVGAIGSVSAELLTRSGIGKITLIDHDIVDETNLQRQLYTEADIGKKKAETAAEKLKQINPEVKAIAKQLHLAADNVKLLKADVILDCTDCMATRFLINDYAMKNKIPWIYAAAVEDRAMLFVTKGSPCFNCIFDNASAMDNCEAVGILNTASTMIASLQVTEALKILLGKQPIKDLVHVNIWETDIKKYAVTKNKKCDACSGKYKHLETKQDYKIQYCRSKAAMSAKPQVSMKLNMDELRKAFKVKADAGIVTVIEINGAEIVVHEYGELLFKDEKNQDKLKELAEKIYSKTR
ncbi:ThiF family adenylyltransferase [Nanoarchaeota archaeon]